MNPAEFHIAELCGFLNATRCILNCPRRIFSSTYVESKNGIDAIIKNEIDFINTSGTVIEQKIINYTEARNLFIELIYKKLPSENNRELKDLDWALIEYYGLISTADQANGPWNRLISQTHSLIRYNHQDGYEALVFFVEYSNFVVATYLGVCWLES